MTLSLRRLITATAALIAASWLLSACSNATTSEAGALATSGLEPATIALEASNQYVTITNNAGRPIEEVKIAIQPIGNAPPFTSTLRRMENGEKREISLSQFRSNDGTTFNPRVLRARQVTVTATDIVGKKHELTKPWPR
jgi:predicted small secreted protein